MPENKPELPRQEVSPLYLYRGGELVELPESAEIASHMAEVAVGSVVEEMKPDTDAFMGEEHPDLSPGDRSPEEIMDMFDGMTEDEPTELTAADALVLIDAGMLWPSVVMPERFAGLELDAEIAQRIINAGNEGVILVYDYSDKFKGLRLDSEIALKLIGTGFEGAVSEGIQSFDELDDRVALALMNAGYAHTVAENVKLFKGLRLDAELADKLADLDGRCVYPIAQDMWEFESLNAGLAHRMIGFGYEWIIKGVLGRPEKFNGLALDADLAQKIIDAGLAVMVTGQIDKFSGLNRFTLSALMGSGYNRTIEEHPDWHTEPSEAFIDAVVERAKDADSLRNNDYLRHLYPLSEKSLQRVRELLGNEQFTPYPYDATDPRAKDRWLGDMSYAYMSGGFSKTAVGRVIRLRLEQGIEHTLHDASQWMSSFAIPRTAYDAQSITRDRKHDGFRPEDYQAEELYNAQREEEFFVSLVNADPTLRQRLNLSSKEGVAEQLFYAHPEYQLLYRALTSGDTPLYKSPELNMEAIKFRALEMVNESTLDIVGHNKDETAHGVGVDDLRKRLEDFYLVPYPVDHASISTIVGDLREMGRRRTNYIRDAQSWLQRHATSPHERLTKVWGDRGRALLHGVADNARAIEVWQKENALAIALEELEASGELAEEFDLSIGEVMSAESRPIREELLRVLSADNTIQVMSNLKKWRREREWSNKLLPEATIPVVLDDTDVSKEKPYRFDVIGADDPRGFTIGNDTGCCMTIHGVSRSCITAGYTERNAGFVAMYTPSGDIAAQSFWYVHPEYAGTLVLDNIEANEGRDMEKVVSVYQKALSDYLSLHPEIGITKVTVGTGFTEVNLGALEEADPVPKLYAEIYSDATKQRKLLS